MRLRKLNTFNDFLLKIHRFIIVLLLCVFTTKAVIALPGKQSTSPYPIDPQVHAAFEGTDALNSGTYRGNIPFSLSHTIYAANLIENKRLFLADESLDKETLFSYILNISNAERISSTLLPILERKYDRGSLSKEFDALAKKINFHFKLKTVNEADRLNQQLNSCNRTHDKRQCCKGLLSSWVFAKGKGFPQGKHLNPNLVTTRAWLSICGPIISDLPKTLEEFKEKYGQFDTALDWAQELHPQSMAKQGGRRVYRKYLRKYKVDISSAQTLDPKCNVTETEVVMRSPSGLMKFFGYDANGHLTPLGIFPMTQGRKSIRVTPESCLGCHYKFDSREFNVQIPSYEALQLKLNSGASNEIHCKNQKDTVIWHGK